MIGTYTDNRITDKLARTVANLKTQHTDQFYGTDPCACNIKIEEIL